MAHQWRPRKRIKLDPTRPKDHKAEILAASEAQRSGFFRLPPEIRIMIYEEAARQHPPVIKLGRRPHNFASRSRGRHDCFSLLHTCSQTRAEFEAIYYRGSCFAVPSDEVRMFANAIVAQGIRLSKITVLISEPTPDCLPALYISYRFPHHFGVVKCGIWDMEKRTATLSDSLQHALNMLQHGNELWMTTVRTQRRLSQILIRKRSEWVSHVHIIYRVDFAQSWMLADLGNGDKADEWCQALGFNTEIDGDVEHHVHWSFGVYYR